jgi:hypothetical protein
MRGASNPRRLHTTPQLYAVMQVALFTALGYNFGALFPNRATTSVLSLWLMLGLSLGIGWFQAASP